MVVRRLAGLAEVERDAAGCTSRQRSSDATYLLKLDRSAYRSSSLPIDASHLWSLCGSGDTFFAQNAARRRSHSFAFPRAAFRYDAAEPNGYWTSSTTGETFH
jgi:hypothetical protein